MPDPWVARFWKVLEISVGASFGKSCLSPGFCVSNSAKGTQQSNVSGEAWRKQWLQQLEVNRKILL